MKAKQSECISDMNKYTFDSDKNCYKMKRSKKPLLIAGLIGLVLVGLFSIVLYSYYEQNAMEYAYYAVMEDEMNNTAVLENINDLELTYNEIEETYYQLEDDFATDNSPLMTASVAPVDSRNLSTSSNLEPINESDAEYSFVTENFQLTDDDYESLLRIVEAEATDEDIVGKILVANVVLNRVRISRFPGTVYEVVHQPGQFSPLDDGRYFTVPITSSTVEAVNRALAGEDYSNGALFFVAKGLASTSAVAWFDENLTEVYKHGVHTFYSY